jgi:hypothetical protein
MCHTLIAQLVAEIYVHLSQLNMVLSDLNNIYIFGFPMMMYLPIAIFRSLQPLFYMLKTGLEQRFLHFFESKMATPFLENQTSF